MSKIWRSNTLGPAVVWRLPALLSDDLHLSTSVGSALSAGLRGGPVKIVYTTLSKPLYKLISTKAEIQSER